MRLRCPECIRGDLEIEAKSTVFVENGRIVTEYDELLDVFIQEGQYICENCGHTFSYSEQLSTEELDKKIDNTVGHGWIVAYRNLKDEQKYIEYPSKEYMLENLPNIIDRTDGNNLFIFPPGESIKAEEYLDEMCGRFDLKAMGIKDYETFKEHLHSYVIDYLDLNIDKIVKNYKGE